MPYLQRSVVDIVVKLRRQKETTHFELNLRGDGWYEIETTQGIALMSLEQLKMMHAYIGRELERKS